MNFQTCASTPEQTTNLIEKWVIHCVWVFLFLGKAPPNLPQGVPPLLHNQYLVGPGGLLPAYPVSRTEAEVLAPGRPSW